MSPTRSPEIADLLAAHRAVQARSATGPVVEFFARCYKALETPGTSGADSVPAPASVQPVPGPLAPDQFAVSEHLEAGLQATGEASDDLAALALAFRRIAPQLRWGRREGLHATDPNFADGHANAVIIGIGGIERRGDVRLGVSLMAPGVTYPDHRHPPEEGYLVMSGGEWRQDHGPWFTRKPGETVHNIPGIWHAMRAGEPPLLALWMLWTQA